MRIHNRIYLVGSEQFGLSHPLDCSCYLIDGGDALGLIDAGLGLGVDQILANIEAAGFDPATLTHIIITHAHLGHWGGATELRERTAARVYAPLLGAGYMRDIETDATIEQNFRFGRYPEGFEPRACAPDETFDDDAEIVIGDFRLKAILVQGHTKDSTCFYFEDNGARGLFTGDVVFYAGKLGLLNIDGFSFVDYRRDIYKLADLRIDILLPGHGVFVLQRGQKHIARAIRKLSDFVMPDTFFETNEFMWDREYLTLMTGEDDS